MVAAPLAGAAQKGHKLAINTRAVDGMLAWFDGGSRQEGISALVAHPAHQLMEQLLKDSEPASFSFVQALRHWSQGDTLQPDTYLIRRAYQNRIKIAALVKRIGSAAMADSVYRRVAVLFPRSFSIPQSYEVYLSTVGWKWGDAMSFSYSEANGHYAVSNAGRPTILFNMTLVAEGYGQKLKEQLATFTNVLAHELFHAVYASYCSAHPEPTTSDEIGDRALSLIMNEGVAHYIADRERMPAMLQAGYEAKAFATLADSAATIFSRQLPDVRRQGALNGGTYGSFWQKYICIPGMFMAYHIESCLGKEALQECIVKGPMEFVRKYSHLQNRHRELPALPKELVALLKHCAGQKGARGNG